MKLAWKIFETWLFEYGHEDEANVIKLAQHVFQENRVYNIITLQRNETTVKCPEE